MPENDIREALPKVEQAIQQEKKTRAVRTMIESSSQLVQTPTARKSRTICTIVVQTPKPPRDPQTAM